MSSFDEQRGKLHEAMESKRELTRVWSSTCWISEMSSKRTRTISMKKMHLKCYRHWNDRPRNQSLRAGPGRAEQLGHFQGQRDSRNNSNSGKLSSLLKLYRFLSFHQFYWCWIKGDLCCMSCTQIWVKSIPWLLRPSLSYQVWHFCYPEKTILCTKSGKNRGNMNERHDGHVQKEWLQSNQVVVPRHRANTSMPSDAECRFEDERFEFFNTFCTFQSDFECASLIFRWRLLVLQSS